MGSRRVCYVTQERCGQFLSDGKSLYTKKRLKTEEREGMLELRWK